MSGSNEVVAKALVISELERNGQIGHTEPGKVFTFNGDATDKYIHEYGSIKLVRVSNELIDLDAVTKVVLTVGGTNQELVDISTAELDDNTDVITANMGGHAPTLVLVFKQDIGNEKKGVYFAYDPDGALMGVPAWVFRIETPETLHPIDPKFLPGVCLPVVEIEAEPPTSGGATTFSEADAAKMDAIVAAKSVPFVVKAKDVEGTDFFLTMDGMIASGVGLFGCLFMGQQNVTISNAEGAWQISAS